MEPPQESKKVLPLTLLMAFGTAGAYWITFRYEVAYLAAFGFPPQVAQVSLETTLSVLLLLSGIVWLLFPIANLFSFFWPKHPAIQDKLARIIFFLLIPLWRLANYGPLKEDWPYYVVPIAAIILLELIWPLVIFRGEGSLRERFIADEMAEAPVRERSILSRGVALLGPAAYVLVFLLLLGGFLASDAGDAKAKIQDEYLIDATDSSVAVIRLYRDSALCVHVDRSAKTFDEIIVKPVRDSSTRFLTEKIGRLRRKKTP
jgi:hypothetical protein